MKTNLFKIAVMMLVVGSFCSCDKWINKKINEKLEKERTTLPPETQTGALTFGCYINGKLFVPKLGAAGFGVPSLRADYYQVSDRLEIYAAGEKTFYSITVLNPEENIKKNSVAVLFNIACKGRYRGEGTLFFTRFDMVNRIVSGIFAGEIPLLIDPNTGEYDTDETLKITEGRFDVKIYNYNIHEE